MLSFYALFSNFVFAEGVAIHLLAVPKSIIPHYATVQPNQDSCDKIEEILLCNVGGIVGMDISINQGFKEDKISELHFYYNENQDFRESYDFTGEISPSITELEERDGVLK